jgi:hypothetical protein
MDGVSNANCSVTTLLGYYVARLLRRSMRQSRILRLRNLALTPLNIAVRLGGKSGR